MNVDADKLGDGQVEDNQNRAVDASLVTVSSICGLIASRRVEIIQKLTEQDTNDREWNASCD